MSLTNFPNGITSFGIPITGNGSGMWLPKEANVYFVSNIVSGGGGTYDSPYQTIQEAVNQVPAGGGSTRLNRGTMIYVNPSEYAEQVEIADRRYIRLVGAGHGLSIIAGGNSSGTTFAPTVGGVPVTIAADNAGLVIAARGCSATGFTFRGVGSAYGIYVGDGGRRNTAWNYVASDCRIYGNEFDGDTFVGQVGVVLDGASGNTQIYGNYFYEWLRAGITVGSGLSRTTQGVWIHNNAILRCRGYGVARLDAHTAVGVYVGPDNEFTDDVTTVLTRSVYFGAGDMEGAMGGNRDHATNGAEGQTTDSMAGNTERHNMNAPVYIAES